LRRGAVRIGRVLPAMSERQQPDAPPPSKLFLELGPLLLFFGTNWWRGIYWATGVFMVAAAIALFLSWKRDRKIPPMMIFTTVAVVVFGGLTLYLHNDTFIKVKVTVLNVLFAAILFAGLITGRSLLQPLLGQAFRLSEPGWRLLTIRYVGFFFFLAILNELVWRNFSTDHWVTFKVFGLMGLTIVFTLLQLPLLQRHEQGSEE
jgi:intracellular septation protein